MKTCFEHYGEDNPFKVQEIQDGIKQKIKLVYEVDNIVYSPIFK